MPTLNNGGGLLLACTILAFAWIGWYMHRDWQQANQRADQEERDAANKADDELVRWMNQGKP